MAPRTCFSDALSARAKRDAFTLYFHVLCAPKSNALLREIHHQFMICCVNILDCGIRISQSMPEESQIHASDLQGAVESLVRAHPDLTDPEKLRFFEELLNRYVATCNLAQRIPNASASSQSVKSGQATVSRFTAFVIALGGGYCPVMLTVLTFPSAPLWLIATIGVIGFFGTQWGAPKLDRWAERKQRGNS